MHRPSRLHSQPFARKLASRLLALLGTASLTAAQVSCDSGGAGSSVTSTPDGGADDAAGGDAGLPESGIWMGTDGVPPPSVQCIDWPTDASACPTDKAVILFAIDVNACVNDLTETVQASDVLSPPMPGDGECCYLVSYIWCLSGRPYVTPEGPALARALTGAPGWSAGGRPRLDGLDRDTRAALAEAWTADALFEHASVASFSRFSLALLAAGAPADLLASTHRAALDEIRHAAQCFSLASAYAGEEVAPGPFPVGERVDLGADLAALAVSTVHEGCVGETLAAVLLAERQERATDPAVREVLSGIAADEARHAELAWRTVAWAIEVGGERVRRAVAQAFASLDPRTFQPNGDRTGGSLEAHGLLDAATLAAVVGATLDGVVRPAARALLNGAGAGTGA